MKGSFQESCRFCLQEKCLLLVSENHVADKSADIASSCKRACVFYVSIAGFPPLECIISHPVDGKFFTFIGQMQLVKIVCLTLNEKALFRAIFL